MPNAITVSSPAQPSRATREPSFVSSCRTPKGKHLGSLILEIDDAYCQLQAITSCDIALPHIVHVILVPVSPNSFARFVGATNLSPGHFDAPSCSLAHSLYYLVQHTGDPSDSASHSSISTAQLSSATDSRAYCPPTSPWAS
jgi:hypothetical protein